MNESTRAMFALLLSQNCDELVVMFKAADGIEEFADKIREYVELVILGEIEWNQIAQKFAELPFEQ